MGLVAFTASRSIMPEHADQQLVELEIDFADSLRRRDVRKYPHRASAGPMQTLYEGADTVWEVEIAPVVGDQLARVREFLDSTADGQTFQIYFYGTEVAPISVKRQDGGYTPTPFIRTGQPAADPVTARFTVVEQ